MSLTVSNLINIGSMVKIAEAVIDTQNTSPQTIPYITYGGGPHSFAPFLIVNSPDTGDPSAASTNDFDVGGNGLLITTTSFNPIGSGAVMTLFCLGPAQGVAFTPSDPIHCTVTVPSTLPGTVKVEVYGVKY